MYNLRIRFAVLSDMIQRCPYNPVTALLLHQLKQEMMLSWPAQTLSGASSLDQEVQLALSDKGPFVTFGAALAMDAVTTSNHCKALHFVLPARRICSLCFSVATFVLFFCKSARCA